MGAINKKQLDLFTANLPLKTRSCDEFDVDNKVRAIKNALKKRYIQPNDFNSRSWLVYDIDRATCPDEIREDRLAPEPTIFVSNPKNRHAHLFYLLKTPVHANTHSSQKALRFAAAVDTGMAHRLGADLSYVGLLAKNAAHEKWEVLHTVPTAYDLHELSEYCDTELLKAPIKRQNAYGLGRNSILFDEVSKWAYRAIRQGWPQYERWHEAVETRTEMLNSSFPNPMDYGEFKHIAKSIAKWTHQNITQAGFIQWQSNNGKRSGKARAKKNAEKRAQAITMRQQGLKQTTIAQTLGVSQGTVSLWLKK